LLSARPRWAKNESYGGSRVERTPDHPKLETGRKLSYKIVL
jgi:hypothetical protein